MADLIIKPSAGAGNQLILQDEGATAALTISDTGITTLAGTTNNLGTVTTGTFQGALSTATTYNDVNTGLSTVLRQVTAAAWVRFNGTGTVAINDSYNVSSVADNGTGEYTVNIATDMANANYSAIGCAGQGSGNPAEVGCMVGGTWQVGNVMFHTQVLNGSHADAAICGMIVWGD